MTPFGSRVLMATGFAKWGMTNGTAAALVLSDLVLGRENQWSRSVRSAPREPARVGLQELIAENAPVGWRMVADRITKPGRRPIEDLLPGEGDIVRHRGEKVAAYRDEQGALISSLADLHAPSAARSTSTARNAAGTARATVRASPPTARSSKARRCTGWSANRSPSSNLGRWP